MVRYALGRRAMKRVLQLVIVIVSTLTTPLMLQAAPCGICREEMERGQDLIRLECNHAWHAHCLIGWDRTNSNNGNCPICARSLRERGGSGQTRLFEALEQHDAPPGDRRRHRDRALRAPDAAAARAEPPLCPSTACEYAKTCMMIGLVFYLFYQIL